MAKILEFRQPDTEDPDIESMALPQLQEHIANLKQRLADLDTIEPADMESEAYENWGDRHELLEDQLDEALDRLDELN